MDELKKFQKKAFTIGVTGMGIAALAGATDDANTSKALGNLGKGLGPISTLTAMDTTMGILSKYTKKRY